VKPVADGYLRRLQDGLAARGASVAPFIMLSNGGVATVQGARANPIAMVESGPASGVLGGAMLAQQLGLARAIVLDIGGTTAKCGLVIDGQPQISTEYHIERSRTHPGYPIQTAVVDIVEIGNGGGSIAWLDDGGKLRVGPRSAGAVPGPVAYGRGGVQLTTTDANLLLGRIDPAHFLGGHQAPAMSSVVGAAGELAERLQVSVPDVARGIVRIANANMINALKLISTNKGWDTRDFALIAIGGGGAMHAVALAQELRIPHVVVPRDAGVYSAWGMLLTDLRRDYLQTQLMAVDAKAAAVIAAARQVLDARARADFASDGLDGQAIESELFGDLRYGGQEHTVKVRIDFTADGGPQIDTLLAAFHLAHERAFTYRLSAKVELVNFHLVARVAVPRPPMPKLAVTGRTFATALREQRIVDFDAAGMLDAMIVERELLEPGMSFTGPVVVVEDATTTVVGPRHQVYVDEYGHLHVHLKFTE
jgi:N-methylhydantoinase A